MRGPPHPQVEKTRPAGPNSQGLVPSIQQSPAHLADLVLPHIHSLQTHFLAFALHCLPLKPLLPNLQNPVLPHLLPSINQQLVLPTSSILSCLR